VLKDKIMKTKLTIFLAVVFLCATHIFAQGGGKAEPNRIKFAKGKTSAVVSGTLSNNDEMDYVFAAKAGQKVSLKVVSNPTGDLFDFTIAGDGFEFQTEYDSYSKYDFTVMETGDYLVTVRKKPTGKAPKAKFFLTLTIK
jgi:hypothetical protein